MPTLPSVEDTDVLKTLAAAVRESGALGRSRVLVDLFEYLLQASLDDRSPKEVEIAAEVFGKRPDADRGADAAVRVYVHRLRGKLADFASDRPPNEPVITLPKGQYRLALSWPTGVDEGSPRPSDRRVALASLAVAAAAAVTGAAGWAVWQGVRPASAVETRIWKPFGQSRFPLLVVTGDYYIFGESDDGMEVSRLIRDFEVDSAADLEDFRLQRSAQQYRYVDLGLHYLPTSTAKAMNEIAPILSALKPDQVITASQLTPNLLKTHDVIYLGYLSGLGSLGGPTFSGSYFQVGANFDELVGKDGKRWNSEGALGPTRAAVYRDYAYVSVLPGPAGNRIAIIAGLRDLGAEAAAARIAEPQSIAALQKALPSARYFEALYEVDGEADVAYRTTLITAKSRSDLPMGPDQP